MTKVFLIVSMFWVSTEVFSQDTIESVNQAFNAGSTKELVRYLNKSTEIKINDIGNNYSIAQAEPILRDFFQQNPPSSFDYIHKGESPQGLKYNIGQYVSGTKSYRVVILLKPIEGQYVVDTITINEE